MKTWIALLLVTVFLSGCFNPEDREDVPPLVRASEASPCEVRLYLAQEDGAAILSPVAPAAGARAGNGFAEAFLTNDMDEWVLPERYAPGGEEALCRGDAWRVEGAAIEHIVVDATLAPAPIVIGGDPGEGYHFFNQFGDQNGFWQGYTIHYAPVLSGQADRMTFEGTFDANAGGSIVATPFRLLLTSLVLDGQPSGHQIILGEEGSYVDVVLEPVNLAPLVGQLGSTFSVSLPGNQGLLTGAIPAQEGFNTQGFQVDLFEATQALGIRLRDQNPDGVKGDADVVITGPSGSFSLGSPYSSEYVLLFPDQLDAIGRGLIEVRVNGYSTLNYQATLEVHQYTTERLRDWDQVAFDPTQTV